MAYTGKYLEQIMNTSPFGEKALRCEKTVAKRLEGLRKTTGYRQEEVARDTGISRKTLSSMEQGDGGYQPSLLTLIILAEYYGVSLDWLCGRDDFT